jgi:hypothetical protein
MVEEFRKPDSYIRGLISVAALSKGFDVSDCGVIIMARPLRSSLSEHIQILGRGLRTHPGKEECIVLDHCIASGQRVLTQRGLVPIEKILLSDTLWDGHEFVSHKGVISRGIKPVIRYAGLTATADHPVKTDEGWRTLGYCAEKQKAIITTGIGWQKIWERDNYFTSSCMARIKREAVYACYLRMRRMWIQINNPIFKFNWRTNEVVQELQSAKALTKKALFKNSINST